MIQYFIKYSLNGRPAFQKYACSVDVLPGVDAFDSSNRIISAVVKMHNSNPMFAPLTIINDDIVVEVLTRLN